MLNSDVPKSGIILRFIGEFLEFKQIDHQCSSLTLAAYTHDLHALAQWCSSQAVEIPTKADMRRFVADMKTTGLADSTVKRRWSAYNQFFNYLIDEELVEELTRSPTRGFKHTINDREESFHLEPEQRKQFFEYLEKNAKKVIGKLDLALFGLLYYAGLRVTEGVTRTFQDLHEDSGHWRLHVLGKRNKERDVVVHPTAFKWLDEWLKARPDIKDSSYLFIHPSHKKVVSRRLVGRRLKKVLRQAGLDEETVKRTSPHSLRHSRASDLSREGYRSSLIQRFLGHSHLRTTGIYIHVADPEVDAAVLGVD